MNLDRMNLDEPTRRLLDASLIIGPLAYLALDAAYSIRGWWDGPTGAAHILVAALYGLTALRLVASTRGSVQTVLLVVALLGIVGNAGVGQDVVHVALGGDDLFQEDGPAVVFKMMGFFFPLTFVIAAVALRRRTPTWWPPLLLTGAVIFPIAHVSNISWLAIIDALIMLAALGTLNRVLVNDVPKGKAASPEWEAAFR